LSSSLTPPSGCLGAYKIPPSLPPHTKVLPAVPTSTTTSLRYTSIVAPENKGACRG
ncbi:hypothetical protein ABG768_007604, partial [Culter alburnus]